jgi:hypothetical protein
MYLADISLHRIAFAAMLVLTLVSATSAIGEEFDTPSSHDPTVLLADKATGANYSVVNPVTSDGFLRIYELETAYGRFRVEGDVFLNMRLKELAAIRALAAMEETEAFQNSFKKALQGPVDFVGDVVTNPSQTVKRTLSGVGRLFNRAASGIRNAGTSPDKLTDSLLGISQAKRQIAVTLGVDPYTDFKPLADRLERAAQVSAAGGLTVRGLFALVPGGIGLAASSASTASSLTNLVRDSTPSELRDINHSKLTRAVGKKRSVNLFLDNDNYTPADQTVIAEALFRLRIVRNVDAYLVWAAGISLRSQAVFIRQRTILLARYHENVTPISEFVASAGIALYRSQQGELIGLFPIDDLAWTQRTAGILKVITQSLDLALEKGAHILITGTATPRAREKLRDLGWTLTEHYRLDPPRQ